MLVDTMNHTEITREIKKDQEKIITSTLQRLGTEYERERKRLKIDKTRTYTREYCIKTAKKNNWIIFLRKAPSKEKFTSKYDLLITYLIYYYNKKGLRVFNCTNLETLAVYNGHFFKRYNERLKLNLSKPLDIVKHFFKYNSYIPGKLVVKEGKNYVIRFCREGLAIAVFQHGHLWLVNKTFVSRDLIREDQDEAEKELISKLEDEIEIGLFSGKFNETEIGYKIDKIKVLNGLSMD